MRCLPPLRSLLIAALGAHILAGCPGEGTPDAGTDPEPEVEFGETLGLSACDEASVLAHPDKRCHTFRGLAGVSMGGGTAARLGFTYPELFDVVGVMGTPFADNEFFWAMIEDNHLGGFCPLEQLEEVMATDGPEALNDPSHPNLMCGRADSFPLENGEQVSPGLFPAVEGSACAMFRSTFNDWYRGPDAGRGGGFKRNSLIEIFHDIANAYGNPLTYNPDSAYFPVGVPESWHVAPNDNSGAAALCANPIVVEGVYNREYNPEGSYPAITFCDGASGDNGGVYDPNDPERNRHAIEYALAVDLNENGIRDYGEPVIINNRERFVDVGADGLADADEPGYDAASNPDPAGDNWDPVTNYLGTEGNFHWDDGEPYDDDGLDGVPATMDYGEGNGAYDLSPTLDRIFQRSPSRLFLDIPEAHMGRMDVWMDAGIRDFINSAQMTNALYGALQSRIPDSHVYDDFGALPGITDPNAYVYFDANYDRDTMGQVAYLRYGDTNVCPGSDDILGEGNHVGPDIIHRMYTLFSFLSARMPAEGRDRSIGGDVSDLLGPTGGIQDFGYLTSFDSEVLGREMEYGVLLPPDYYFPEAEEEDRRYPVLYFFHGQGQSASDMVALGLVLFGAMKESSRPDRLADGLTDFQRAIIVWVDGECGHGDDCWTGTFYADFEGLPRQDRNFEQAFVELMNHVESTYRVKKPGLY